MRRLSAEERALWGRVAGTIRPVGAKKIALSVEAEPIEAPAPILPKFQTKREAPTRPARTVMRSLLHPLQNTLDANWDKRLKLGQAAPDFTIDLHGETLSTAHARLNRSLATAIRSEARIILLITGRPAKDNPRLPPTSRGVIRASVGDWLAASPYASHIAAIRNAHPRHGGAGALYLILRRPRA